MFAVVRKFFLNNGGKFGQSVCRVNSVTFWGKSKIVGKLGKTVTNFHAT